jgi:hypothetical protein
MLRLCAADLKGQLETLVARKQNVGWSSLMRPAVNSETPIELAIHRSRRLSYASRPVPSALSESPDPNSSAKWLNQHQRLWNPSQMDVELS